VCLVAADSYIEAIGDLTGADTLSGALSSVGEAFEVCSTARTSLEADPDLLALTDDDRAHLLEPLVDLLDTMSLHTIVLAIGVADPTVFDAGPAGADGFRRPTEHLADAVRRRWGILLQDSLEMLETGCGVVNGCAEGCLLGDVHLNSVNVDGRDPAPIAMRSRRQRELGDLTPAG